MEVTIWNKGAAQKSDVDTEFLGDVVRVRLLRHAVRMYETNRRQGTHKTKSRGELHYRKAPLFKQKGTGRARVRHPQATQCRHGGVPHGPKVRDYSYAMPKKARREATRSALLSKFRDQEIALVSDWGLAAPKTKTLASMLESLGFGGSVLVVSHEFDKNLLLSARNLRRVTVVPVEEVNAYDLLRARNVLMTQEAFATLKESGDES
ncbi:MAG: 50S ribosomal protein L4 [Planctomycetota bacterium]